MEGRRNPRRPGGSADPNPGTKSRISTHTISSQFQRFFFTIGHYTYKRYAIKESSPKIRGAVPAPLIFGISS